MRLRQHRLQAEMIWLRKKLVAGLLGATATIQVLQILILPTWLDWVTNGVILLLIAGTSRIVQRSLK